MKPSIIQKFTTHLKTTLERATDLTSELRHVFVNPEHLIYGLTESRGGIASEILTKANLQTEALKVFIAARNEPLSPEILIDRSNLKLSLPSKRALEKAVLVSSQYRHKYVGTEHLLFGLIELKDPTLIRLFDDQKISIDEIRQHLIVVLKSTSKFPDLTGFFENTRDADEVADDLDDKSGKNSALEFFATDLTDRRLQKDIDPVIGRSTEIDRLVHILSRRTKNNPVLIGDPGVGKTAIVEGLAKKIIEKDVPDALRGKRLLSLDMSLLVAGTMYRGEFESRLKQVIEEIKSDPNLILFIDEIHTIVGTGSASGSMDAANILKPALAKGNIRCIGATTIDEYRKHIESDPALERRFQAIMVDEPTAAETITILKGVRSNYEKFHRVAIADEAIDEAVALSVRYIQDKFLPDKAIDLIDEAASKLKVGRPRGPLAKQTDDLESAIAKVEKQKLAAVNHEDFDQAVLMKNQELSLRRRLLRLRERSAQAATALVGQVRPADIAEVVARITGIPVKDLVKEEKERLMNLEQLLKKWIVGQDEAIDHIANFVRRSRVGLGHPNRPIGSFIFLGPSGVGKTETAKKIAEIVFEDPKSLIRIDMSEYGESFNASKLIGAPAGYVGYKDQNSLTDQIRRKPYAVVLLDEIEKAHPEIFNLFLQVLDDGQLTDATGRVVNFKNTIVIMTSNVGVAELNRAADLGFSTAQSGADQAFEAEYQRIREHVLHDLERQFRPEFLNRIDEIIVFRPLSPQSVIKIIRLQIDELRQRLTEHKINLVLTPAAEKLIAQLGFKPEHGARAVRRVIQDSIENPLAGRLIDASIKPGSTVTIGVKNDQIILN